jgi:hypothetical protein
MENVLYIFINLIKNYHIVIQYHLTHSFFIVLCKKI